MMTPAAMSPFGLLRIGPDTSYHRGDILAWPWTFVNMASSGYHYGHDHLLGFSHTRLVGTGLFEGGHMRVTPYLALSDAVDHKLIELDHTQEFAEPGYYRIDLHQRELTAEMTAREFVGYHRYVSHKKKDIFLLMDTTSTVHPKKASSTFNEIEIRPDQGKLYADVNVYGIKSRGFGGTRLFFVFAFDKNLKSFGIIGNNGYQEGLKKLGNQPVKALLKFSGDEPLEVRVSVSQFGYDHAENNAGKLIESESFDQLRKNVKQTWQNYLSRISIQSSSLEIKTSFYSSLYRSFLLPTRYDEGDRHFKNIKGERQQLGAQQKHYYSDLSLWDTMRTLHPLYQLIAPKVQADINRSLIGMAEAGGMLPKWPLVHGYTGVMIGSPAAIVLSDSALKNPDSWSLEEGYESAVKTLQDSQHPAARIAWRVCQSQGYYPADKLSWSVSRTIEYAWADYAMAQFAKKLAKPDDEKFHLKRAAAYHSLWNREKMLFMPRKTDGSWVEPLFPLRWGTLAALFSLKDYTEGSAYQWRWAAPPFAEQLVGKFASRDAFVEALENFLMGMSEEIGAFNPGVYYWHGNEHNLHAAYLFNEAGRSERTQKWVRKILQKRYQTNPQGLDGNDDGGTLSAWYLFSSLGFYPIVGTDQYWIGSPNIEHARLKLSETDHLTIRVSNQGRENVYINSVLVNGKRLCSPRLHHKSLLNQTTVEFFMSATPSPAGGFSCDGQNTQKSTDKQCHCTK